MATQQEHTDATRRGIIDAFWKLAVEKGMGGVSVRSIMKEVGMHRSTFYEYFDGVDGVLRAAEDELLEEIGGIASEMVDGGLDRTTPAGIMQRIFPHYGRRVMAILGPDGDPGFLDRLKDVARPAVCQAYDLDPDSGDSDAMVAFIVSLAMGVVARHLGDRYDEEEVVAELTEFQRIAYYGIRSLTSRDPFKAEETEEEV